MAMFSDICNLIPCLPLLGLLGVCFIYTLLHLDTCYTEDLTLTFNLTTYRPLLVTQTVLFSVLYKISATVICFISITGFDIKTFIFSRFFSLNLKKANGMGT